MKKYGFGVDIGGTTIKMSLFEMTGHMLDKWEIPTNTQNNGASILDDVAAKAAGACAVYQVDVDKSPDLAAEYAPNGFPTYVLFVDGSKMKTLTGEQTEAALLELAQQA